MPLEAIKRWQFSSALKALLDSKKKAGKQEIELNPGKQFLLFFNGTSLEDVDFFKSLHKRFEAQGTKLKILAFVKSKVDVQHFGMALYNESSLKWNQLPKENLVELVRSRSFDILININPGHFPHMHYLAVAANASFKISTPSEMPNDFNLFVKSKGSPTQPEIFQEMRICMETLSMK